MKKKISFIILIMLVVVTTFAQQDIQLTDGTPTVTDGLKTSYSITGASEKEVGSKGNFSRFKIRFSIENVSTQAKMILYKPNSSVFGNSVSSALVKFKCLNATGARMTSKELTLEAKPCIIDAMVETTDCGTNKTKQERKPANIGYWIKPGEVITSNTVMIVPLNDKPTIVATLFPGNTTMGGSVLDNNNSNPDYNYNSNNNNNNTSPNGQSFVHIKNTSANMYLNNQNGPVQCTAIDNQWWSAQWEVLPVNGTNNFVIKNRWKNNYISTDNTNLISDNGQSNGSMWTIDETGTTNTYTIKNVGNGAKLIFQNGSLKTTTSFVAGSASQWVIE